MRPSRAPTIAVHRAVACLLLASSASAAPFQCTGEPDPALAVEQSPAEALYRLAESFREAGKSEAWKDTLRYIVERFRQSRFSAMAADDLVRAGEGGAATAP